jgi:hypothetical protein
MKKDIFQISDFVWTFVNISDSQYNLSFLLYYINMLCLLRLCLFEKKSMNGEEEGRHITRHTLQRGSLTHEKNELLNQFSNWMMNSSLGPWVGSVRFVFAFSSNSLIGTQLRAFIYKKFQIKLIYLVYKETKVSL